jgi:hypothetical protein
LGFGVLHSRFVLLFALAFTFAFALVVRGKRRLPTDRFRHNRANEGERERTLTGG